MENETEKKEKQRTLSQNAAIHLWFEQQSYEANEKGLTLEVLFRKPQEMRITPELLKEYFKQYAWYMFKKDSTAKLTVEEMNKLIEVFEQVFAERFDTNIPFPSIESMEHESLTDTI